MKYIKRTIILFMICLLSLSMIGCEEAKGIKAAYDYSKLNEKEKHDLEWQQIEEDAHEEALQAEQREELREEIEDEISNEIREEISKPEYKEAKYKEYEEKLEKQKIESKECQEKKERVPGSAGGLEFGKNIDNPYIVEEEISKLFNNIEDYYYSDEIIFLFNEWEEKGLGSVDCIGSETLIFSFDGYTDNHISNYNNSISTPFIYAGYKQYATDLENNPIKLDSLSLIVHDQYDLSSANRLEVTLPYDYEYEYNSSNNDAIIENAVIAFSQRSKYYDKWVDKPEYYYDDLNGEIKTSDINLVHEALIDFMDGN